MRESLSAKRFSVLRAPTTFTGIQCGLQDQVPVLRVFVSPVCVLTAQNIIHTPCYTQTRIDARVHTRPRTCPVPVSPISAIRALLSLFFITHVAHKHDV
jgi:hypothetical protein